MRLSELMSAAGLAFYAEVALVVFFVTFLGILWFIFNKRNRKRFDQARLLPFADDEVQNKPLNSDTSQATGNGMQRTNEV